MSANPDFLGTTDAAALLGITEHQLKTLVTSGDIQPQTVGRAFVFPRRQLAAYAKTGVWSEDYAERAYSLDDAAAWLAAQSGTDWTVKMVKDSMKRTQVVVPQLVGGTLVLAERDLHALLRQPRGVGSGKWKRLAE